MFKQFSNLKSHTKNLANGTNLNASSLNSSNSTDDGYTESFESYETYSSTPNKTKHIKFGKEFNEKLGEQPHIEVFHEADDGKGGKLAPEEEAEELKRFFPKKDPKKESKHHKRRRKFLSFFDE